jgi:drug/metabolite transporter (DMT)-like permease
VIGLDRHLGHNAEPRAGGDRGLDAGEVGRGIGSLWVGNGVQNLSAGIVLLPFAFTLADVSDIVPSARLLGAFAFLVLGGSILAYLLWFHLLKVCGATAASAYHFLMPPLGIYLVTRPAVPASTERSTA